MSVKSSLVSIGIFLAATSWGISCPGDSLSVSDPLTQQQTCLQRWSSKSLVMVTESDCHYCQLLLKRIQSEARKPDLFELVLVWVDSAPDYCLSAAQKFSTLGKNVCSSRRDVEQKWKINSTPTIFWKEKGIPRVQKGLVDTNKPLLWNIP
ncbi:MAG: hypothetical protein EB078_09340 [Proteobacteria bacterium]|nr:hypothetical protein [Pseudomonadota bacterium]NDC25245.1 hypothetical protein [Pseudomonadota bacterium]NDD05099.1 hypothetical protein [Pseudomonadota bacterium]NDG26717.1 hypothetical protein [Pseudomonadota bacterium]